MSDDWFDDAEEILQRLASVSARIDPVPADVVEAAIACFSWRSLDAELAELLFDSGRSTDQLVGVRSQGVSRQLSFETSNLTIELEVDLEARPQLVGQLAPAGPAEVEIRSPDRSFTVQADELGRFSADNLAAGAMSLRVVRSGRGHVSADTPWVSITLVRAATRLRSS